MEHSNAITSLTAYLFRFDCVNKGKFRALSIESIELAVWKFKANLAEGIEANTARNQAIRDCLLLNKYDKNALRIFNYLQKLSTEHPDRYAALFSKVKSKSSTVTFSTSSQVVGQAIH